jgi:IS30 family transposase
MGRGGAFGSKGRRLSMAERSEIRRLVAMGLKFQDVADRLRCSRKSVQRLMNGFMDPPPASVYVSEKRLTYADREEISRGLHTGESFRAIALRLNRAASTVSREVNANGGRKGYRAWRATKAAVQRAKRPNPRKIFSSSELLRSVNERLAKRWSPEQISVSLRRTYPGDTSMHASPEIIYQALYLQARASLKTEVKRWLRTGRVMRKARGRFAKAGRIKDMVLISERPAEAEDRAVPGHWEGDLLLGKVGGSAVGTLVERSTRFVMLMRLPEGKTAERVNEALIAAIQRLPDEVKRSLTWDQSKELAEHKAFTIATGVQVYLHVPRSPRQRGSNENTNGLQRQYLPKNVEFKPITQEQLDAIAAELNTRPRKTLDWATPAQALSAIVATIP